MRRTSKVLLSALGGAALLDLWLLFSGVSALQSELMAPLAFIPFLAAEAILLYSLNKAHSITWNLVSTAAAVPLAILGGVALETPRMLFNWGDWKLWVLPAVWYLKGYIGSFLFVPPLLVYLFGHLRSNNRWRGP